MRKDPTRILDKMEEKGSETNLVLRSVKKPPPKALFEYLNPKSRKEEDKARR